MIHVELPIPPSMNNAYATNKRMGGRFMTQSANDWKFAAGWALKGSGLERVKGPYRLEILLPSSMRGDASNRIKLVEDLLVEHGFTPDDRHAVSVSAKKDFLVSSGKCLVGVESVESLS